MISKTTWDDIKKVERGWGYELWIENLPEYCGKILHFRKDSHGSLHFHMNKSETMFLQSGRIDIMFIDHDKGTQYVEQLYPGDSVRIPRGQCHQIVALEESDLFEFSTFHEESDSYRIVKGD